jgi:hypothetical protein
MTEPSLPAQADYLRPLVGTWVGDGQGLWASDPPLRYREEVTFAATGKPFLSYRQQTWAADDGRALHSELGHVRAVGAGRVEMLIVQPTGFTEIHVGALVGGRLALTLTDLRRTPTAATVTDLQRQLLVESDVLTYQVRMAMNDEPLADHLRGRLRRAPAAAAAHP